MVQLANRLSEDGGYFVNLSLSGLPITSINGIPDAGEKCLVVTGPGFWCEEYMFELGSIGKLSGGD